MLKTGCFMEWYCLQKQRGEKWVRYFHTKIVSSHRWECVKEITLPREVFEFQGYFSTTKKCLQNWTSPFMTAAQEQILLGKQRAIRNHTSWLPLLLQAYAERSAGTYLLNSLFPKFGHIVMYWRTTHQAVLRKRWCVPLTSFSAPLIEFSAFSRRHDQRGRWRWLIKIPYQQQCNGGLQTWPSGKMWPMASL